MAKINLDNYETVEERLMRFKNDNPNFRMESAIEYEGAIGATRWIVKVTLWRDAADPHPVSTGWAFEVDGKGMTQAAAALETCETSALGRALANCGYVGNKRVTREEMVKVKNREVLDQIAKATSERELQAIYNGLNQEGLAGYFVNALTARKNELTAQMNRVQNDAPPPVLMPDNMPESLRRGGVNGAT